MAGPRQGKPGPGVHALPGGDFYMGAISPAPDNLLNGDFSAGAPNSRAAVRGRWRPGSRPDFMPADWAELPNAQPKKVSGRIINAVRGINRV